MRISQKTGWIAFVVVAALGVSGGTAGATSVAHQDLVDLIHLSEIILAGQVTTVSDGFDARGVPYTEVTVAVDETLRGPVGASYTFRQFGLAAPRSLGNGRRYLGVSPDGWPRFKQGEKVVLFLYKKAARTGLRTTVGLLQGKFEERNGHLMNGAENEGLFDKLTVNETLLSPAEAKMLKKARGPVVADTFLSLVRKAVQGRWIEKQELDHVK